MKAHVKVITFHPKILTMSEEDYAVWLDRTGIKGVQRPKVKVKPKKEKGGGQ